MAFGMLRQYEDEIRTLEDEIHLLAQKFYSHQELTHSTDALLHPALKTFENATDLKAEHDRLEIELAYLRELTGTDFTEYSRKTVQRNDNHTCFKYRLAGNCGCLPYTLEFELLRNIQNDNYFSVVTQLSIMIESDDYPEFSKFVSKMEERKNLLLFFRAGSAFSELLMYRKKTFRIFKERYPDLIRLPEGSSAEHMVVSCPQITGSELIFVWKIHVSEEGTVTPALHLLTKIPEQALKLDKTKVAERAPAAFRTLLKVYGIETAMEKLIKAFAMLN